MENNLQNIFFNTQTPEVFHNIVRNRDIEDLLLVPDVPQSVAHSVILKLENKDFPEILPRKAQKKHTVTVKVKSIGKIRKTFEADQLEKLPKIIEKNEELINTCLRQRVSSQEWERSSNKILLESLLNIRVPLSRAGWKALTKLNLYKFKYPKQVFRVNETAIILCGSLGGNIEGFDCDLSTTNLKKKSSNDLSETVQTSSSLKNVSTLSKTKQKKRGILACTNVEFKPGPLSRKPTLSKSIRHDIGPLELVKVPPVGLEVFPRVGVKLDSAACYHLKNIRQPDGRMDVNWVKFATSLVEQQNANEKETSHTFIVPYENNQRRILMQKDLDFTENFISQTGDSNLAPIDNLNLESDLINIKNYNTSDKIELTVKNVLSDLINTVAIAEIQDRIWKYDDDYHPVENNTRDQTIKTDHKKLIKRKNSELKRLDVTVIDVNEVNNEIDSCSKKCCRLGCVCSSLQTSYLLNEHCGRPECMLECSCKLEKFSYNSTNDDSTLEISKSAVVNFQNHMNRYLAKEEKKFKRTVIRSKDQTIVMGACRRGSRIPKKYEDFYFDTNAIDQNIIVQKEIKIIVSRLPKEIKLAPWCMVHQLYMCFCKGLFIEGTQFKYSYWSPVEKLSDIKINDDHHSFNNEAEQKSSNIPEKVETVQAKYSSVELDSNTCARTTYYEKYIKKSRKCKLKYAERNSRIKRVESEDPSNIQILLGHIDNNFKVFTEENNRINKVDAPQATSHVTRNVIKEIAKKDSDMCKNISNLDKTNDDPGIPPPVQNNTFVYRWSKLIKDYRNKNIYIWVTLQKPLKTYITSTNKILSKQSCLPIPSAVPVHESILDLHPPMLRDIVEYNSTAHRSVILIGKLFAWELVGSVIEEKKNPPEKNTLSSGKPDTTLVNVSKKLESLFVWPKLSITKDKKATDIEKETCSASANTYTQKEPHLEEPTTALVESTESPEITTSNQTKGVVKSIVLKSKIKHDKSTKPTLLLNSKKRKSTINTISLTSNSTDLKKSNITLLSVDNLAQDGSSLETITTDLIKSNPTSSIQANRFDGNLSSIKTTNPVLEISSLKTKQSEKSEIEEPIINCQKNPDTSTRVIKKVNILPRQNIPTLKLSSKQLIKLPATVTAPLVTSDHKYRWLLLHIEDDFTEIKVPEKKFQITREDIVEAMTLAEKSGKTCKFPPCSNQQDLSVPVFGIYAVPGNRMKEVFIGPYLLDEKMGLKIALKKGISEKRTWGSWTKALDRPHIIVCNREKIPSNNQNAKTASVDTALSKNDVSSKLTNTVVVLEPFATYPVTQSLYECPSMRSILKSAQNVKASPDPLPSVEHSIQATPNSHLNKEKPNNGPTQPLLSKVKLDNVSKIFSNKVAKFKLQSDSTNEMHTLDDSTGSVYKAKDEEKNVEDHKMESSEDDGEDDVIFMPTKEEIVEISDSEEEVNNDHVSVPSQVWFICTNIPLLGYIAAMQNKNNTVVLKFSNLGPIECSDPTTAKVSINLLLTSYVGFEPKSLSCKWRFVKDSQDVQNLKPFDERKLNKYHVITEDGLVARGLGSKRKDSPLKES